MHRLELKKWNLLPNVVALDVEVNSSINRMITTCKIILMKVKEETNINIMLFILTL